MPISGPCAPENLTFHPIFGQVDLAVPCGNMGNMVSALIARSMGLPFGKMIIACNSNNVSRCGQEKSDPDLPGVG